MLLLKISLASLIACGLMKSFVLESPSEPGGGGVDGLLLRSAAGSSSMNPSEQCGQVKFDETRSISTEHE